MQSQEEEGGWACGGCLCLKLRQARESIAGGWHNLNWWSHGPLIVLHAVLVVCLGALLGFYTAQDPATLTRNNELYATAITAAVLSIVVGVAFPIKRRLGKMCFSNEEVAYDRLGEDETKEKETSG